MKLTADSKRHHIIAAGSVITFHEDPLTLTLPLEGEDLVFIFSFHSEKIDPHRPRVEVLPCGDRKLELQFVNFDYDLGTGNVSPIELGMIDEKPLYLNYRIYALADSDCRLLHYTFYQAKS
ncbi:hypothetical protein IPG41_01110 [Candidatus Peregrinibacteria bacterium]|nr:MAG: hypothetical protein IPG41_01110 [Candidatus Peregrinibacteria bacterium]